MRFFYWDGFLFKRLYPTNEQNASGTYSSFISVVFVFNCALLFLFFTCPYNASAQYFFQRQISAGPRKINEFRFLNAIAASQTGNIYISDSETGLIKKFDSE